MTTRGFAITPITLWRRRWLQADAVRERRARRERDRAPLGGGVTPSALRVLPHQSAATLHESWMEH